MKLTKLIPLTTASALVATCAPIALSSCGQYRGINLIKGYTPSSPALQERMFDNYEEATQYYLNLDKQVLSEDYLWSIGEYVREKMEFPSPVLPFKWTEITEANISLEDWWTQPYPDSSKKNLFISSYAATFKIGGYTCSRNSNSYVPDSFAVLDITTNVSKLPYVLKNKYVGNTTDARWYIEPASNDVLKEDSVWNVSSVITLVYSKKDSHDRSISTTDTLSAYWHKNNLYDPEHDPDKSYLYPVIWDALIYGSYHLQNCTIKN